MAYTIKPSVALLHPVWLGSLAVLALNDHVLKGAEILPSAVTGKLSDVAGLLVAPLLLAALLGVARWRSWVACHIAVGLVFAGIQVSAVAASGWSTLMGWVGVPWIITSDVTDLLTLPMLAASLWGFLPAMQRSAASNARKGAQMGAASVGLLCCVATSRQTEPQPDPDCCWDTSDEEDSDGEWDEDELPPFRADVYLHNATSRDLVVRIRPLRSDVALDCDAVAESPGSLLRSSLFAPATSWTLPANSNVAVQEHAPGLSNCYVAWVEADALPPTLLMWFDGDPNQAQVPAFGTRSLDGEVGIMDTGSEGLRLSGRDDLVHAYQPVEPVAQGQCATQPDAQRVGWSTPVPWGGARITAIEPGVDGCLAIDLAQDTEQDTTWYLCVPPSSFPFEVGAQVDLRLGSTEGGTPGAADVIEMVATEGPEPGLPMLTVGAGQELPLVPGLELAALPSYDCDLSSEPVCGTVERPMTVVASGLDVEAVELMVGDGPRHSDGDGRTLELTVLHAQERFVVDPACALGPSARGTDLEVVIAQWPTTLG